MCVLIDFARHAGVEDRQPAGRGVQCPGDVGAVGVLGEVAVRAGMQGVENGTVVRGSDGHDAMFSAWFSGWECGSSARTTH
ncbi:MAG TPA: hypothetical protein VMU94_21145 [Streptosporangiaceae bacterium]|nr:hypothetical protein [Streptosporangiaceae bacterium]